MLLHGRLSSLILVGMASTFQVASSPQMAPAAHHHGHGDHQGTINYTPGIFYGYGPGGAFGFSPPVFVIGSGGFFPNPGPAFVPQPFPAAMGRGGLMLPMPPAGFLDPIATRPAPRPRQPNPARAKEQVEVGDRSFRAGDIKRAEDKYKIAAKADPSAPSPHVHMAQVSMVRGDYASAADRLRDAVTVAPNADWLLRVADIQAIFVEPADFAKQLARLESHLQANPNDRDAWFVLGAECYLSGRTKQASDVFQRLTDRRPDEALAAFLDASKTKLPPAN
jgi:hypothetical protein